MTRSKSVFESTQQHRGYMLTPNHLCRQASFSQIEGPAGPMLRSIPAAHGWWVNPDSFAFPPGHCEQITAFLLRPTAFLTSHATGWRYSMTARLRSKRQGKKKKQMLKAGFSQFYSVCALLLHRLFPLSFNCNN